MTSANIRRVVCPISLPGNAHESARSVRARVPAPQLNQELSQNLAANLVFEARAGVKPLQSADGAPRRHSFKFSHETSVRKSSHNDCWADLKWVWFSGIQPPF